MIFSSSRVLLDTNAIMNLSKNHDMARQIISEFELSNSQLIVTSQSRKEIQKLQMNFDKMKNSISEPFGIKITELEITSEIKQNAHYLREKKLGTLHSGDDLIVSAAITSKSTLFTSDRDLARSAKKFNCPVKMIPSEWYN
tara:strand:+ start:70 stop:492 length:423 start_codon:yes stop_codon:yes gene_type:complete